MRDAERPRTTWAAYLRELTDREGWTVARLAKEAGIHRSTIFRWLEADASGPRVTVDYVVQIAHAAGVPESRALHAAAGLVVDDDMADEESIRLIMESDAPDDVKQDLVTEIRRMQRRAADERVSIAQRLLDMTRRARGTT